MSEYKVGDKFEIVKTEYNGSGLQVGDIVEFVRYGSWEEILFLRPKDGKYDEGLCFEDSEVRFLGAAKETEAEKRGAKFGVCGVIKKDSAIKAIVGKKISFAGITKNSAQEEVWNCVIEGEDMIVYFLPSNIRLDHEPEYREIPFSEATHEQRMDAVNLRYSGSPVVQISHFSGSGYAFTYKGSFDIHTDTNNLTIRIPT